MNLRFVKYQGAGNDFVMIDNRSGEWNNLPVRAIQRLCDRRFGIGADGLIKINALDGFDFEVDYYNSDGSKSFCGNGARCAVAFAEELGIVYDEDTVSFMAIDGEHTAFTKDGEVFLHMNDVTDITTSENDFVLNTGSPHYVHFTENLADFDMVAYGKQIRYSDTYKQEGINVNAVHQLDDRSFEIRTYERGVEDETLSCGTGITAAALALAEKNKLKGSCSYNVRARGGFLSVRLVRTDSGTFNSIWLIGPAEPVFKGEVNVWL